MRTAIAVIAALAASTALAHAGAPKAYAEPVDPPLGAPKGEVVVVEETKETVDMCYDKGSMTYFPCPTEEVVVVEEPKPVVHKLSGFYIGVRGGVSGFDETKFTNAGTGFSADYDTGYAASGLIGYEFADFSHRYAFRVELEAGYQGADVDDISGAAGSTGDLGLTTVFANAYADIGLTSRIDIVLGGGLGVGFVDLENHGTPGAGVLLDDDDAAFAFHLDAGVSVDLTKSVSLEALYRYTAAVDADLTTTGGASNGVDVDAHQGLLGLRWRFY